MISFDYYNFDSMSDNLGKECKTQAEKTQKAESLAKEMALMKEDTDRL